MLCRTHFDIIGWSVISSAILSRLVPLSIQRGEMSSPTIPRCVHFLYPALPGFVCALWKPGCFQPVAFSTLSTLTNVSGYVFLWIQVLEAKDWGFVGVCLFVVFPNWGSVAFICSDMFPGSSRFNPSPSWPLISEFSFFQSFRLKSKTGVAKFCWDHRERKGQKGLLLLLGCNALYWRARVSSSKHWSISPWALFLGFRLSWV